MGDRPLDGGFVRLPDRWASHSIHRCPVQSYDESIPTPLPHIGCRRVRDIRPQTPRTDADLSLTAWQTSFACSVPSPHPIGYQIETPSLASCESFSIHSSDFLRETRKLHDTNFLAGPKSFTALPCGAFRLDASSSRGSRPWLLTVAPSGLEIVTQNPINYQH